MSLLPADCPCVFPWLHAQRDVARQGDRVSVVEPAERPDAIVSDAVRMLHEGQAEEALQRFEKAKDSTIQLRTALSPASLALAAGASSVTVGRGEYAPSDGEVFEREHRSRSTSMFGMASLSGASAGSGVASHFEATTPGNLNLGGGNLNSGGEGLAGVIEAAAVGLSLPAGDYGLEGARERGERRSYSQLAQPLFDEPDTVECTFPKSEWEGCKSFDGQSVLLLPAGSLSDLSPADRAAAMIARSRRSPTRVSASGVNLVGGGGGGSVAFAHSHGFGLGDTRVDEIARRLEPFTERPVDESYASLLSAPPLLASEAAGLGNGALRVSASRLSSASSGPSDGRGREAPLDLPRRLAERMARTWHEEALGGITDYFSSVAPPNEKEADLAAYEREVAARRAEVRELIEQLNGHPMRRDMAPAVRQCLSRLERRPQLASDFAHEHGLIPVLELLQHVMELPMSQQPVLVELVLQLLNGLAQSGARFVCENLCLLGAVPAVQSCLDAARGAAESSATAAVHLQIAMFLNTVCRAGPATLAMLLAADALPVLVVLIEPELPQRREQTRLAVDCIWCLFQMRSWKAPRFDLIRKLGAQDVLLRLARGLHMSARADGSDGRFADTVSQAADVLLLFSHADGSAAQGMLANPVLQDLMLVLQESNRFQPQTLLTVLQCVRNLSMGPSGHVVALQRAGAVVTLVFFLDSVSDEGPYALEMRGQVLLSLYHLCKLNRLRQEQAVVCPPSKGIVPHLQDAVVRSAQLKHVALPMLCDIARASKRSRTELWKHSGAGFYLELLAQEAWRDDALEALAAWLVDEPRKVEAILEKPDAIKLLVEVLDTQTPGTFLNLLDSLKKILHASPRVNQALGDSRFVPKLVERLSHPTPVIRVALLRMLTSVYEHHRNPKKMVMEHNLMRLVERMVHSDKAVLVKEIAGQLQKAFKANDYL